MAVGDVVWGTWRYGNIGLSSKNGMRVGMAIYWGSPNSGSASVGATVEVWTENEFTHSGDSQRLNYSTNLGADTTYTNNSGRSPVLRATKSYSYPYTTWGSSPGNVTFTAELTEHYWDDGTNPTISRTLAIPARPGGPPSVDSASVSAGIRSATISWTASGDPGITSYAVYRNNDGNQLVYSGGATSVTDTALSNGQSVYYIVYAFNAAGNGSRLTGTVTTPSVPGAPGVSSTPNNGFISVSYSAPGSDGGTGITSYQYSANGGAWTTTPSNPFNISGANGTAITVAVRAVNGAGEGGSTSTTNTPRTVPTAPTSFAGNNATFGQLALSWAAPSSNGGAAVTTYKLFNGATLLQNSLSTSYTHTGLLPYADYSYTVVASNVAGDSPVASLTVKTMGGIAKVWNGTSYVTTLPKVWNGTTWTDAQARMWNGTEWKHGI
jgi:hypothetical protein